MNPAPRVAITPGCPCGVGPEVVARALAVSGLSRQASWVVVGAAQPIRRALRTFAPRLRVEPGAPGEPLGRPGTVTLWDSAPARARLVPGQPNATADATSARALRLVLDAAQTGQLDAVATGPVRKQALQKFPGGPFPGHTELFHHVLGTTPAPVMLFVAPGMRLALHSIHVPLRQVPATLTPRRLRVTLEVLAQGLTGELGLRGGRVDVLGLNPHAGEGGLLGREELAIITPTLAAARRDGLDVRGPFPADGYFARYLQRRDRPAAVLALFHDQGLAPFKLWERGRGCQMTLGLSVPRTSCDHGTAYDIAGHGTADGRSMAAAMRLAVDVARRRIHGRRV